ncbi:MAG: response regulator transcription factor [Sulfurimonadaceae bacterium]|jgi:DNA-binding response OmpR family regulator
MKILLLEDDLILSEIIEEHLISRNFNVKTVYTYNEAQDVLYGEKFDILLLDVNVPGENSFTLLKELRQSCIKTPAIFITSLNMIEDVEKGFIAGCDDYIKKPFEFKELDIRLNNIQRLYNLCPSENIKISDEIFFNVNSLIITKNKQEIGITKKECEILHYLIKSNKTVSMEELYSNVWAYEELPNSSTVRTYIKTLRKIIGKDRIINIKGIGYRFNQQ